MEQSQEIAVAQMRESVQKLGSSTERYGDLTLMRFLISRSMDAEKAAKMFVEWQKWRASFVPLNYIPESEIGDELNAQKFYLQGRSRKGHALFIVKANKHFPAKDPLQFKKFVVYSLDKAIASSFRGKEIGNEMVIALYDLQKTSYKNIDVRSMITGFQVLQAYYPERLARLYMLNVPGFFFHAWRLVSRVLEKSTSEKVVLVRNEEENRELIREIGEEALPEEYGGQAKLVLLQDFVLPPPLDH